MSVTVSIRTVAGATASLNVEPTITIAALRQAITEQCGLGFCTTLVFKGQPLKKDVVTLGEINYTPGETLVGVFKKEAPKAAAVPAPAAPAPIPADLPAPVTPVKAPVTTQSAAANTTQETQPPATTDDGVDLFTVDWECPTCTYINIGARTICEMCATEDPNKAKLRKPSAGTTGQQRPARQVDQARVEEQLRTIDGYDQMDEATQNAVRMMIEEDLQDAPAGVVGHRGTAMGDDDEDQHVTLVEYLRMLQDNPEQRAAFCTELGLPLDCTDEELTAAVQQRASTVDDDMTGEQQQQAALMQLLQDPAIAGQLETILQQHQGNPEALQEALLQLLQSGVLGDDEDDEDIEFDDDMLDE